MAGIHFNLPTCTHKNTLLISIISTAGLEQDEARPRKRRIFNDARDIRHYLTYSSSMDMGKGVFMKWTGAQNKMHMNGAWGRSPQVGS